MNRLRKWFGIEDKDPDVPLTFSSKKPTDPQFKPPIVSSTDTSVSGDVNSNSFTPVGTIPEAYKMERIKPRTYFPEAVDTWLRNYVPLAPNECLECKLVHLATITIVTGAVASAFGYHAKVKKGFPSLYRNIQLCRVVFSLMGMGILYQRWYNLSSFAPVPEHFTAKQKREFFMQAQFDEMKFCLGFSLKALQKIKDVLSGKDL